MTWYPNEEVREVGNEDISYDFSVCKLKSFFISHASYIVDEFYYDLPET